MPFLAPLALSLAACGVVPPPPGVGVEDPALDDSDAVGVDTPSGPEDTPGGLGDTPADDPPAGDTPSDTPEPPAPPPGPYRLTQLDRRFGGELISGDTLQSPTGNDTHHRFNLMGTDLGVPVVHGDRAYLFFGDTVGWRAIWTWGEDPDSVAHLPLAALRADPTAVTRDLTFLVTPDVPSVAAAAYPGVARDFAGAAMIAPPGQPLQDFIADGAGPFPWMPGTFEVPTGALSQDGAIWLFYAGLVDFGPPTRATASYLARFDPGTDVPTYTIVRGLDALQGGAMGGHFIQVAPIRWGGDVYLFGTGAYRRSGVTLAKLPAAALSTGAGTAYWDGAAFVASPAVPPIFEADGVGELSVLALEAEGLVLALYQRELRDPSGWLIDNSVVLRVAPSPTGPWSDAVPLTAMTDPAFQAEHCCARQDACPGAQILHCDRAGLYGAYLLPAVTVTPTAAGVRLDVPFLASTWDPYNVVMFTSTVDAAR
jgi:hypothetical protein